MLSTLLSILLLILKIIGILLLVILGTILIVLLVPIRYQFAVSDKADEKLNAQAGISWLLSIISFRIQYAEKKVIYYLKIAGFTLRTNDSEYLRKKREKKIEKARRKRAARKKKAASKKNSSRPAAKPETVPKPDTSLLTEAETNDNTIKTEEKPSVVEAVKVEPEKELSIVREDSQTDSDNDSKKESQKEKKKTKHKDAKEQNIKKEEGIKEEKPSFMERIEKKMEGIGQKIEGLGGKIDQMKEKAEDFQIFKVLQIVKIAIFRILKHILPRKLNGWLRFGFDDPSLTGKITAAASIFYPKYRKSFTLEPDFQEKCLEGDCSGKGLIRLGYLLWVLITLLLKKEIRKVIKFILNKR